MKKSRNLAIVALVTVLAAGTLVHAQQNRTQPGQQTAVPQRPQVVQPVQPQSVQLPNDSSLFPIDKIPVSDTIRIPVLDFKNADVRDVLRGLGMQYKLNIFIDPEVTGLVTLYLTNVSVRSAIDFIAKRSGFAYTVENGIVKIYKYKAPPAPLPPKPPVVFHLANGLLNIDIKKLSVQEVAQLFADSASINVMVEGNAEGDITARLASVKIDKAVRAIYEPSGFTVTVADGIHYVSKTTPFSSGTGTGAAGGGAGPRHLSFSVKDGLVNLEVDNAPLDQTIRSIANESGMNIVVYDRLTGDISAKLAAVPVDDALRYLLQNTKFTMWKENSIYFIGSREMNQQKTTSIIPLKHIMADESVISAMLPPAITTGAVVKYDKEHNALVVIGSFDVVAQAQEFINKIDKPVAQVLIEALVIDFNLSKINQYGFTLFTQSPGDTSGNWLSEKFSPGLDLKPGRQRTQSILHSVLKEIGIDKLVELPANFRSEIQALESANIIKVLSTPQIATINGNPASITIGETRYYLLKKEESTPVNNQTAVIGTDQRFEVLKFNNQLSVTPWVMEDGYVMVKIRPEFNLPQTGGDATTPPNVNTRVIESMVRLRNGQTIVLGGQRQTESSVTRQGVPILGSIPILGWLFSSRTITKTETQMMIFLTPHVYYGDDNQVSPSDFFDDETKTYLGEGKDKNKGSKNGK
ncbi:MAG: secretin N-terminal domain-containing protein [Chitinispirillaceae bacterium]|jgi:type II secretory pathway component GspD/PulD (secretin)